MYVIYQYPCVNTGSEVCCILLRCMVLF